MMQLVGLLIIAVTVYMVARRVEVRLVLLAASFAFAAVAGVHRGISTGDAFEGLAAPIAIVRVFFTTFSNEKFVVPICAAMGFAYVLKETGCDRHLVELLTRPFARVRPLLVPGAVIVGFLVNIPLISQTSTAVAVGTVLVPLLRASGLSSLTIASALVLGSSLGGELLNQAAPELRSVAEGLRPRYPGATAGDCVAHVHRVVWWELAVATGVFWAVTIWAERRKPTTPNEAPVDASISAAPMGRLNPIKALVPFVPLLILFLTSPSMGIVNVPRDWLVNPAKEADKFDSRLIGAAMLIGAIMAAMTTPRTWRTTVATFFDGAGYGFANIIGLIVVASCFGEGIKLVGLNAALGRLIEQNPGLLLPLAAMIPMLFGLVSGSGMAATQSLFEFYVGPIETAGADPFHVGSVVSLGAAAGRTISPVAAVNLMSSRMAGSNPFDVSKRVALPMLAGLLLVVILAMLR